MNNPISGASYLLKGFQLIQKPGIRRFVIIPLLVNIIIFAGLGIFMFGWFGELINQMLLGLPEWLHWLEWLMWPLMAAAMLVLIYFTFAIVANFVSAPFNGLLAETVETHATGKKQEDDSPWHTAITGIVPALREEIRKLVYSITRSIPFLILFFIPVVNVIASPLWLIFGAWLLAIQYCDYPMANHKIEFNQQRQIIKQKRFLALGFGGAVLVALMIPIVNFFVLPSAVAGATLMYLEQYQDVDQSNL